MMRGFVADPADLLAAWRAKDRDPARRMAEARSFGTTKEGGAGAGGLAAVLAGARGEYSH